MWEDLDVDVGNRAEQKWLSSSMAVLVRVVRSPLDQLARCSAVRGLQ